MIDLILALVIIALLAFIAWERHETRKEQAKLINALVSKNAQEMVNLELSDKTQIKAEIPKEPDLIPEGDLPQKEWEEAIKNG